MWWKEKWLLSQTPFAHNCFASPVLLSMNVFARHLSQGDNAILRSILTPKSPITTLPHPPHQRSSQPNKKPPHRQGNRPHHPKDRTVAGTAPSNARLPVRRWLDVVPVCLEGAGPSRVVRGGGGAARVQVALPQPKPRESEAYPSADSTPSTTPCRPQIPSRKATLAVGPDNIARAGRTPTILITAPSPPPPPPHGHCLLPRQPKPPPATPPVQPPIRWRLHLGRDKRTVTQMARGDPPKPKPKPAPAPRPKAAAKWAPQQCHATTPTNTMPIAPM